MALRARGIIYPKTSKKAELLELVKWALQSEATGAAPVASCAPAVFPETYDWDQLIVGQSDAESDPGVKEGTLSGGVIEPQQSLAHKRLKVSEATGNKQAAEAAAHSKAAELGRRVESSAIPDVHPGTQQFDRIATAAEAAQEKELAGENRAVEHVALFDAGVCSQGVTFDHANADNDNSEKLAQSGAASSGLKKDLQRISEGSVAATENRPLAKRQQHRATTPQESVPAHVGMLDSEYEEGLAGATGKVITRKAKRLGTALNPKQEGQKASHPAEGYASVSSGFRQKKRRKWE